jgi:ribosomal-protein-alanine N-acetyltransferase
VTAAAIRAARFDDIPALLALEALFPSDRLSRRSLRRFIANSRAAFLVAEHEGRIRGNLLLLTRRDQPAKARIYSVIVDPAARGLGLAQQLVHAAERAALQRGCTTVTLEVRADNRAALSLYRKLGYAVERELPGYYDDGADGLRLAHALHAHRN